MSMALALSDAIIVEPSYAKAPISDPPSRDRPPRGAPLVAFYTR